MTTMIERVHWLNEVAQEDFDRAQGMLDMLNVMSERNAGKGK